jgi:N-acetylmuramoyl-L-alanine amidase
MKKILLILLITFCFNAFSYVVLIDPGHGGEELGAITRVWVTKKGVKKTQNVYEKDLALLLARKVKIHLEGKYTTYLTRSIDRGVTLDERANMADTVKADLFVSIHFNSSTDKRSNGFETFYLDNHVDKAIKKVEEVENKDLSGSDKTVNQILIDLVIQKTAPRSKKLAKSIHRNLVKSLKKKFKIKDRGIKPGLFYVLALSKRPGVLIEAGFMSNPKEFKTVKSIKFLDTYAKSIALGIKQYLSTLPPKYIPLF